MENQRKEKLKQNYKSVFDAFTCSIKKSEFNNKKVVLVAVSKKRPSEDIKIIYDQGQRIFGENYVAELIEKSLILPKDIEWHLIGHLQSNKVKKLLENIPNIVIESVDSIKIAKEINKFSSKSNPTKVYIEINISKTETKTGANIEIIDDIAKEIVNNCPNLKLVGIMSLGNVNNKEEFNNMIKIKNDICEKYNLNKEKFIASFGTSQDFENAILSGSDEIRVGHQIFEIQE